MMTFFCFRFPEVLFGSPGHDLHLSSITLNLLSPQLSFFMVLKSILLKEPFALKNSETVYFSSILSTPSYSDNGLIDNFDLIFFYFYFVFEIFGNNSVSNP